MQFHTANQSFFEWGVIQSRKRYGLEEGRYSWSTVLVA